MHYVLRRALLAFPTLLVLSFSVFLLLELAPGSTADAILEDGSSEAAASALCAAQNCDEALPIRYISYMSGVLRGDMGVSARTGRAVNDEIALRLPYTLTLTAGAISLALVVGGALGTIAALKHNTRIDVAITAITSVGAAAPTFWVALLLVGVFALQLGWLPVFGAGSWQHFVLPVLALSLALVPGIARITRGSLLETIGKTFVQVAASKGLSRRAVFWRHIRPAAAIPIVTYVGLQAVHLIGSLVTIEVIFNLPGLGGLALQAALDRDPLLLQGVTLAIAALTFAALLAVDVLVMLLDPRIARASD